MTKRELKECTEHLETITVNGNIVAWLAETARAHALQFLLAHADDGVVWGRLENDRFMTPFNQGVGADLREQTLQEARIFDETGEVLVWRTGPNTFKARLIRHKKDNETPSWSKHFDERHYLWGDKVDKALANNFTRLREGAMGHLHAPPVSIPNDAISTETCVFLTVRHYVTYQTTPPDTQKAHPAAGLARIAASRLVGLSFDSATQ